MGGRGVSAREQSMRPIVLPGLAVPRVSHTLAREYVSTFVLHVHYLETVKPQPNQFAFEQLAHLQ